jgi:hypothetical protein
MTVKNAQIFSSIVQKATKFRPRGTGTSTKFLITKFLIKKFLITTLPNAFNCNFILQDRENFDHPDISYFVVRNSLIRNPVIRNFVIRNFVPVLAARCGNVQASQA